MHIIVVSLVAALLLIAAHLIFRRVGRDYERQGKLTPFSSFLEVVIFALHGMASYFFLDSDLGHVRLVSPATFLAIIAIIPTVVAQSLKIPFMVSAFLGGTGLLIVVSVALDLVQRIEANLIMRNYKGFLGGEGPIKGSRG